MSAYSKMKWLDQSLARPTSPRALRAIDRPSETPSGEDIYAVVGMFDDFTGLMRGHGHIE